MLERIAQVSEVQWLGFITAYIVGFMLPSLWLTIFLLALAAGLWVHLEEPDDTF